MSSFIRTATYLDHLASSLPVPRFAAQLIVTAALILLSWSFFRVLKYLITPKPFGFIPHLDDQQMVLGDAGRLAKFIKQKKCHTAWFEGVVKQLGNPPLCEVVVGPGNHTVIVNDIQEAEDMLLRRSHEFDRSDLTLSLFSPVAPTSQIATPTNAMWKLHRRVMGPTMTSSSIKKFAPRASKTIHKMIELWKLKYGNGIFDPRLDIEFATTDTICEITFGECLGCLDSALMTAKQPAKVVPNSHGFVVYDYQPPEVFTSLQWVFETISIRSIFPRIDHFFRRKTPTYKRHTGLVNKWIFRKMEEGRKTFNARGSNAHDMVDCVMDVICLKDRGPDALSHQEMRDELLQYLVAGQDTGATSLLWAVKYLARNPSAQRKLHQEIMEMDLDGDPTYEDITKMAYLEAATWELLRLAAAAPSTNRKALVDVNVLGHVFPAGTTFFFPLRMYGQQPAPHHDVGLEKGRSHSSLEAGKREGEWDPATIDDFDPERWLNPDGSFNAKAGPAVPFSLGQRGCFGRPLAVMEMKLFLFHIIGTFFFDAVPTDLDSFEETENVTRKPDQCFVKISPWPDTEF